MRASIVPDNKRERQGERKIGREREREKREKTRASAWRENQMNPPRGRQSQTGSYLLCSAAGASSTWACVFLPAKEGDAAALLRRQARAHGRLHQVDAVRVGVRLAAPTPHALAAVPAEHLAAGVAGGDLSVGVLAPGVATLGVQAFSGT